MCGAVIDSDESLKNPPGNDTTNVREPLGKLEGLSGNFVHRRDMGSLNACYMGAVKQLAKIFLVKVKAPSLESSIAFR